MSHHTKRVIRTAAFCPIGGFNLNRVFRIAEMSGNYAIRHDKHGAICHFLTIPCNCGHTITEILLLPKPGPGSTPKNAQSLRRQLSNNTSRSRISFLLCFHTAAESVSRFAPVPTIAVSSVYRLARYVVRITDSSEVCILLSLNSSVPYCVK
jgi:hypothetical protein